MRFLTLPEYDAILLASLRNLGLSDTDARTIIAARWPMDAVGVIAEAGGRGLIVDAADVAAFVVEAVGDDADGAVDGVVMTNEAVELFLRWAVENDRARLTPTGRLLQRADTDKVIRRTCRRAAAEAN